MNKSKIKKELKNAKAILRCAKEFNMVGDPTRLKICYLLCQRRGLTVSEIAEIVEVSISAVSHTLKKLQETNIVENHRDFRNVYYKLKESFFTNLLKRWLKHHAKI